MKLIKLVLNPEFGWHIRIPSTYRVERTYPVVPPTILFGIVQNLMWTSSHKTPYRDIVALGGFPTSNVALSLEMQRIAKMYTRQDPKTKRHKHIVDRHEIEVAHSGKIDCYLIVLDYRKADEYGELLEKSVGDVVHLTTSQFPTVVTQVKVHEAMEVTSDRLLFGLSRENIRDGMPYVLPLRYEFLKKEEYRAQKYGKVLLPFSILSPIGLDNILKRTDISLENEIDVIRIDGVNFDKELLIACRNAWADKNLKPIVGTI